MFKKLLLISFVLSALLNAAFPAFERYTSNEKHFKELSKIFGEKVLICDGSTTNKSFLSTFERLDKQQQQKLKKQIDLAYSGHTPNDQKYINDIHSVYLSALHNGIIRPDEFFFTKSELLSFHKSSRAPPQYS